MGVGGHRGSGVNAIMATLFIAYGILDTLFQIEN
jgi:hypothetical protein